MSDLYPPIAPYESGYVTVSEDPPHKLWVEQYGNPEGEPMLFVHGGPGAAAGPDIARFFDPKRFRIVNFHQRGAGRSQPFLSLADNTTPHLIGDIIRLREILDITGPMHVFGGSWGSFLALIYAIQHPDTVASLTLRGIFLGRGVDIAIAYQRDAQLPRGQYHGGAQFYPEAWERFVAFVPPEERGDIFTAYHRRIHSTDEHQLEAARHWYGWEDAILRLRPLPPAHMARNLEGTDDVMAQAILETHYFRYNCFLDAFGGDDAILKVGAIAHIPVTIVQGRYDLCTPRYMADELVAALNVVKAKAGLEPVNYVLTVSGHLAFDEENPGALADAVRKLKPI